MTEAARFLASLTPVPLLDLRAGVDALVACGVDGLHVDIADGHFAPFLLLPPSLVGELAAAVGGDVEAHPMVSDPESYLQFLAESGVRRVTYHAEATRHPWRVASVARKLGVSPGIAFNLATPLELVRSIGDAVDYVNLLGADHDLAGDRLLRSTFDRVRSVRALVAPGVRVQVDGGVGPANVGELAEAGAQDLVVGRALYGAQDRAALLQSMRGLADRTGGAPVRR